jgi:hypothetical protein
MEMIFKTAMIFLISEALLGVVSVNIIYECICISSEEACLTIWIGISLF